jgi:thiol-disulfide isomerase/thioredoxin
MNQQNQQNQQNVIEIINKHQLDVLFEQFEFVILDIYGDYCQPCKIIRPFFEKLSLKYKLPNVVFTSVNVEKNIILNLKGVPTFQIYHKGKMIEQVIGADSNELQNAIARYLKEPMPQLNSAQQVLFTPHTFKSKDVKKSNYKVYGQY